jgi:TusA-related sulfurtransferase
MKKEERMSKVTQFFSSRRGIISAGIFVGAFAPLLQWWGNPGNMGICVACMERDIAGALGLHRAAVVQYIRPEIIGFVLGVNQKIKEMGKGEFEVLVDTETSKENISRLAQQSGWQVEVKQEGEDIRLALRKD